MPKELTSIVDEDFSAAVAQVLPHVDPINLLSRPDLGNISIIYPFLMDNADALDTILSEYSLSTKFVAYFEEKSNTITCSPLVENRSLLIPINVPEGTMFELFSPNENARRHPVVNRLILIEDCTLLETFPITKPIFLTEGMTLHINVPENEIFTGLYVRFNEEVLVNPPPGFPEWGAIT